MVKAELSVVNDLRGFIRKWVSAFCFTAICRWIQLNGLSCVQFFIVTPPPYISTIYNLMLSTVHSMGLFLMIYFKHCLSVVNEYHTQSQSVLLTLSLWVIISVSVHRLSVPVPGWESLLILHTSASVTHQSLKLQTFSGINKSSVCTNLTVAPVSGASTQHKVSADAKTGAARMVISPDTLTDEQPVWFSVPGSLGCRGTAVHFHTDTFWRDTHDQCALHQQEAAFSP